jgi:hypothetical protein
MWVGRFGHKCSHFLTGDNELVDEQKSRLILSRLKKIDSFLNASAAKSKLVLFEKPKVAAKKALRSKKEKVDSTSNGLLR